MAPVVAPEASKAIAWPISFVNIINTKIARYIIHINFDIDNSLNILYKPIEIITPTPSDIITTIVQEDKSIAWLIWLERISKSGSAIDIIKPIKIPNKITLMILSKRPRKSPIIDPIFDMDKSIPVKNIDRPNITPRDPRIKLISKLLLTPTNIFKINTRITIGRTALVFSFTLSKNIVFSLKFFKNKEAA